MAFADRVVVRVEEHAERGMKGLALRIAPGENERLEEPRGVREMPLRRARLGHRLDRAILGGERSDEGERLRAHSLEALRARAGIARRTRRGVADRRFAHRTSTRPSPSTMAPTTLACANPSALKMRNTSSHADAAQATSNPPLVCGSVRSAFCASPTFAPSGGDTFARELERVRQQRNRIPLELRVDA